MNYSELEQAAYLAGDTATAILYARIIELENEVDQLEKKLSDAEGNSLEKWERSYGPAYEYYQFFNECFSRLDGHYPYPSIGSDYDQSRIFAAIERGEGVTE